MNGKIDGAQKLCISENVPVSRLVSKGLSRIGRPLDDINKAIESRDQIIKCIEKCTDTYNTDPDNVTLLGFSQGSILINAVALTYPKKIKNIISLSGGIDPNIIKLSKSNIKQ